MTMKREQGGYVLSFPDIPEAHSEADTREDALVYGQDALLTAFEFYVEDGRPVPLPSALKRGQVWIEVPVTVATKLLLLNEMSAQKVRPIDLARKLGMLPQEVNRLLDLRHRTKIDAIAQALNALGKRLELSLAA